MATLHKTERTENCIGRHNNGFENRKKYADAKTAGGLPQFMSHIMCHHEWLKRYKITIQVLSFEHMLTRNITLQQFTAILRVVLAYTRTQQ